MRPVLDIPRVLLVMLVAVATSGRAETQRAVSYRLQPPGSALPSSLSNRDAGILEKLNRADLDHLSRLPALVVPDEWLDDELAYSPLPRRFDAAAALAKALVVYVPGQAFGAYESGTLVRWGPISSGAQAHATLPGVFHLNWRATGHVSTVDPDWYIPWYFNFDNQRGRALHEYALPGEPASHGCIRLLQRDARWLFEWGDVWTLDTRGINVIAPGTLVLIVGSYDFGSPPPWRSLMWLRQTVELPASMPDD